jgi:hypothetical protein
MVLHQADFTHDAQQSVIYAEDLNATQSTLSQLGACTICKYVWSLFEIKMPLLSEDDLKTAIIRHAISTSPLEYAIIDLRTRTRLLTVM